MGHTLTISFVTNTGIEIACDFIHLSAKYIHIIAVPEKRHSVVVKRTGCKEKDQGQNEIPEETQEGRL